MGRMSSDADALTGYAGARFSLVIFLVVGIARRGGQHAICDEPSCSRMRHPVAVL